MRAHGVQYTRVVQQSDTSLAEERRVDGRDGPIKTHRGDQRESPGGTGPAAISAAGPSVGKIERQGAVGDRWRTRGVEIRHLDRETEVPEDARDDGGILDRRDQA